MFEDPNITFFKGNGVRNILKRYEFSEEERKIINAAILTARKEQPDSRIMARADALLKEVAQTRKPLEGEEEVKSEEEVLALFEMYKQTHGSSKKAAASIFSKERRLVWAVIGIVVLMMLIFGMFKTRLAS